MPDLPEFQYDVFLSHSAKDKKVVREIAELLRTGGLQVWFDEWVLKPGDNIPAKVEEGLERSRILLLCMSANAFDSDWAQLESGTFRFRDPLNKQRRFLPLRLDDAPIRGSLAQILYIDWRPRSREQEYSKLTEACRPPAEPTVSETEAASSEHFAEKTVRLQHEAFRINAYAFSPDGQRALTGDVSGCVKLWDLATGNLVGSLGFYPSWLDQALEEHDKYAAHGSVLDVRWSPDGRHAISSGGLDCSVKFWSVEKMKYLGELGKYPDSPLCIAWSTDERSIIYNSGFGHNSLALWDLKSKRRLRVFQGHTGVIRSVAYGADMRYAISGAEDTTVRVWEIATGECIRVFEGHTGEVGSVALSPDGSLVASGSSDNTVRLWAIDTGHCVRVMEGHTDTIRCLSWSNNQHFLLSGSRDNSVRLWNTQTGLCLCILVGHQGEIRSAIWSADGYRAFSGDERGVVRTWNLEQFRVKETLENGASPAQPDQIQYTNAKVLVVGESGAGKTGLSKRLVLDRWELNDSTVGAWATHWKLPVASGEDIDREIWLWDFGGQADQRLIHQLFMDRTALILLLFNADQEDVLPGLRDWQTALRRSVKEEIPNFLVAGRIDTGFKASRGKLHAFAQEHGLAYYETSAKSGEGCDELRAAMVSRIPWIEMEKRTSPRIFKLIKDEILKLRDEGQVLHTFKELRELLWRRLPDELRFADEILHTVVALLDGPGVVKELDYGTYILLAPEWINAYAQAVIRTLRGTKYELGALPLRSIAEGKLLYQNVGRDGKAVNMKRLPEPQERVVLAEMERQLEQRGLCLRQGAKLVFPSHCGRDRPAVLEHPSVFVSYLVKGFLDDIYATLAVRLADSESFQLKELWRDAADFVTLAGEHQMGIKLTRESSCEGTISVYFGKHANEGDQVIFANYIHAHLNETCETVKRLRYYVCPNCGTPKGNPQVLTENLLAEGEHATAECDRYKCRTRFPLWDALERKFASEAVRRQVEGLQAIDAARLESRRKSKLLALEVGSRIASAEQECFEVPAAEDEGIHMELEFTTDEGKGTGKRLYLQLKSGNSHLEKRKSGAEIFKIEQQKWVQQWIQQPHPVMLVIGTFAVDDDQAAGKEKLELADVRWMEISSLLKRESQNGTRLVKEIEFKGERLDLSSVRQWRERVLKSSGC